MKKLLLTHFRNKILILLSLGLFISCSTDPLEMENSDVNFEKDKPDKPSILDNKTALVYEDSDCTEACIIGDSGNYFIKGGSKSVNVGPNIKEMSYAAYNTENSFVVNVTYEITDGNAKANATIYVSIDGNEKQFGEVPPGSTVTHSIQLPSGWEACDEVSYSVRQEALGEPVEFSGTYNLFSICTGPSVEIGELVPELGGYVFYILQEGDPGYDPNLTHGLVAATEDHLGYRVSIPWSNENLVTNATGTGIGAGKSNTEAIVTAHGEGVYAAYSCSALVLNGFDDWYLPSRDEFILLHENLFLNNIGQMYDAAYWTSTEIGETAAIRMYGSGSANALKTLGYLVRAIRSF